ncbi:hypothetical protein HH303_04045 [Rhodospirillaceae bacterium KN72]|uniref:Uncharacterized protein n=1 Tax=Pacificispira spongiicola TaxID=2729598 RepID=A0A7Y0DZD0_9PROT|nr:hypothetical protein [Pacificispira spongiicola]NMM43636.1 hypothetical protein [Pacificispira spongiicola]
MSDLRSMIREVLREELSALKGGGAFAPQVREETVSIGTNADLQRFVARILELSKDAGSRAALESGRHVFRLGHSGGLGAAPSVAMGSPAAPNPAATRVQFDKGLVSEKAIADLPDGTRVVRAGKTVRFTPLASDELRRRGIKIERAKS